MSRKLALLGALLAASLVAMLLAGVAGASQSASHPTVRPRTGTAKTKFVVRFRAPETLSGGRRYTVEATTTSNTDKCDASASAVIYHATAGQTVKAKLKPTQADHKWCFGKFHGTVELVQGPVCDPQPAVVCPLYMIAPQQVGTFSFRVRKHS